MIKTCCAVCIGTVALVHAATCSGESLRAKIHKGNVLYHQGLYDDALQVYNDAQIDAPESPELNFNIGDVNYRKEDHENAIETYRKSFSTEDTSLESKANYNLGNSKYRLGEKTGNNTALWREALEHYRKAIELDPTDEDAKFNFEFVEKKIQEEMNKQQEQQEQQQQEQQQQEQQQQDKQEESESSSEQERQQKQSEQQQEEKPQEQQEQDKDEEESPEEDEQPMPAAMAQAQAQPEQTDEQLAEQEIFSILRGEEKAAREQAPSLMVPYTGRVLKDW